MRVFIFIIAAMFLSGCYSEKKAKNQFAKAAIAYPEIPAQYCAITYPPRDSLIKGKDSIRVDTLWGEGQTIIDTVRSLDTIRITKVIQLPGKIITKTIRTTDTMRIENTAKIADCEIEKNKAIDLLQSKTKESIGWEDKARKRFLIMLGLIALIVLYSGFQIYKAVKPIAK